ncbi:MAG: molybdate ABC transporter substrate-binding protein [Clostridiales bacterium]|nr:molybdate ABC transporter substrate-binding protein [Clostridiales bacterium]MCF8022053.1 molybdate ABC transporter substrate-binding protein [Clostridiales bacterium]
MLRKRVVVLLVIMLSSLLILTGCGTSGSEDSGSSDKEQGQGEVKSLHVFSGAGLRKPMDDIGALFEEKYGVKIEFSYAGSAQCLNQLKLSSKGDVYVPGAKYYFEKAKEDGLVDYEKNVAYHIPVIGVPEGNPAGIQSLEDLTKDGVKVVLGDESACAIGRLAQKILKDNNIQEDVAKNVVAKAATVNELVVYLTMKQGEASLVWEDNIANVEDVEIVEIAEEKNKIKTIPACAAVKSDNKEMARKFVDFVASKEGKQIYEKHGFKPVQ